VTLAVRVEADGGSRGNPGRAGYGAVVMDAQSGQVLAERKEFIGTASNNVAEYRGLIAGLEAAAELGAEVVTVRMDSQLVIEQMSGRWQVKHPAMRPLASRASELAAQFREISFEWIPREQNKLADRLANEAMDAGMNCRPQSEPTPQTAWVPPDSMPTRLILLRHGVTEHTLAKRFAGRSDAALTELGHRQARLAADRVARLGPVDASYSSPLGRARDTAAAVTQRLGLPPALIEDGFVETDFGEWDGCTFAEVAERWPRQLKSWLADPAVAPPGGESFSVVTDRVAAARDRVLADQVGKTVLITTHVSPIKVLVRLALDAPASALYRMFLAPASISIVDYFSDGPTLLRSFNDSAHLPD
jgi:broad specificity phosphatase PhoE/ribonuclease HI